MYEEVDGHWLWRGPTSGSRPAYQGGTAARYAYEREFGPIGKDQVSPCTEMNLCVRPLHCEAKASTQRITVCARCGQERGRAGFEKGRRVCRVCRAVQTNAERANEVSKAFQRRRRLATLQHYGGACACCGESNEMFLVMDHVNDDGAVHRKETGYKSVYVWLNSNGLPTGFQVLCHNCNYAKSRGGCPHGAPAGQPGGGL